MTKRFKPVKLGSYPFRTQLVSCLTQLDEHETITKPNIYRIGIYLEAVNNVMEDIANGASRVQAFQDNFNPTKELHKIATCLGLDLKVERGQWVQLVHPVSITGFAMLLR